MRRCSGLCVYACVCVYIYMGRAAAAVQPYIARAEE